MEMNQALVSALDDYLLQSLDGIPREEELAAHHSFSRKFERRMLRLLRRARRIEASWQASDTAGQAAGQRPQAIRSKRLLVAAIVLTILISIFSITAAREAIIGFFVEVYKSFSTIIFNSGTLPSESNPAPAMTLDANTGVPRSLPEGYRQTDVWETGKNLTIYFVNAAGDMLVFERALSDSTQMVVDTEGIQYEKVQVRNLKGVFYSNKGVQNLIWQEGSYAYLISGKINKEEMINMANSTD